MKQTYSGGCHCGAVRYEVDLDLSQGTLKCNCSICGIKSFARARTPNGEGVAVMVSCLENIPAAELAALPVIYVDGLHDDFKSPPAETRHL